MFEQSEHVKEFAKQQPELHKKQAVDVWLYMLQFVIFELAKHELALAKKQPLLHWLHVEEFEQLVHQAMAELQVAQAVAEARQYPELQLKQALAV